MSKAGCISLRRVTVHNLKSVDLDIPRGKLVVFCGLSGSGKSSLALDTLYAEGQRRYIESFSAYTRQFLDRLEKPEAERIDGLPPAIAVTGTVGSRAHKGVPGRSSVGTTTEIADYLLLLFAKIGMVICRQCGREVRRDTPQSVAAELAKLPNGTRFMLAFEFDANSQPALAVSPAALRKQGFVRAIIGERVVNLDDLVGWDQRACERRPTEENLPHGGPALASSLVPPYVIVDRLAAGTATEQRIRDSLEIAFAKGSGKCFAFVEDVESGRGKSVVIDDRTWQRRAFSNTLACADCGIEYAQPEPRLFSFNSPLGACPVCEGFGNVATVNMNRVVPDASISIREGAIAPWNTPAYAHELEELLALAPGYNLPVDVPFEQLTDSQRDLIAHGVRERDFGGLDGFFAWLQRKKYKMHIRVFLSRWRSYRPCPACGGARLRPEALDAKIGGQNIAQISAMQIAEAMEFFRRLVSEKGDRSNLCETPFGPLRVNLDQSPFSLSDYDRRVGRMMLEQVQSRLGYLESVGLGYLTLDRTMRTLSGGEARRVALTSALGASLVNMLYVLDEPSIGLHPGDVDRLVHSLLRLRDRGNTVVVVEHEEAVIRAADRVVEIGPGAGDRGGRVVFQGTPAEIEACPESLTGDYLAGRRGSAVPAQRREPKHGWIRLAGARGNNLKNITVEFPLGVLCVVTGVSGSGKSTLIDDTLYPAVRRRLGHKKGQSPFGRTKADSPLLCPEPLTYGDISGEAQIDEVILVDQSPIGRSPRSNPVTYLKAFDEIRNVFAETVEARTRNFDASYFSFNLDAGRCSLCQGDGFIKIDMQFLPDVYMKCSQCQGARYRDEILDVTYRGRNIAEVLDMTVREAFTFFRGQRKLQARLKRLIDVGLDYVRLGQPANTLSGGEAQRLKLAAYMSGAKRGRCLFLLDEPTTGLHFADVVQLLDCFDALIGVGHSLIVVEHNLQVMKAADYIIDLGPGPASDGGRIVAKGTPEAVARNADSATGKFLAKVLTMNAN